MTHPSIREVVRNQGVHHDVIALANMGGLPSHLNEFIQRMAKRAQDNIDSAKIANEVINS